MAQTAVAPERRPFLQSIESSTLSGRLRVFPHSTHRTIRLSAEPSPFDLPRQNKDASLEHCARFCFEMPHDFPNVAHANTCERPSIEQVAGNEPKHIAPLPWQAD
jgi:hypothetical protein